ncbi:MAG: ABC transporter permease [Desulfomonile tiedjei]|nr:ABC transporter permease [Desulfomonile tiedjei]
MMNRLSYYWDLTVVLTKKEIKIRYKSSVLGYLWSVVNPLSFALVCYLAFQIVFRIGIANYPLFLICGLFPWQWFSNSVNTSTEIFLRNSSLIKKTIFPKSVIVLALVLQDMIHYVLSLPVIAVVALHYQVFPTLTWLYGIPLLLLIQLAMTYGAALFLASINLFFRDMARLVSTLTILVFYCTPILYSESMIPPQYQWLLYVNPLAPLMANWRSVLLDGCLLPDYLLLSAVYALLILYTGHQVYERFRWRFAEVL